ILGQLSTRNVHVPGLAIGVNRGRVVLTVHGHRDGVTGLDVFTHGTGNGHVRLRLGLVDYVVTGNGVDGDRSFRQIGVYTVATVSFSARWVARSVFSLNLGVYVRISSQLGTRTVHVPGLAISITGGRVILTVDRYGHGIASLHILANRTGNGHVRLRLGLVDHIVT